MFKIAGLLLGLAAAASAQTSASATKVLYFDDARYTDVAREAMNMKEALQSHTPAFDIISANADSDFMLPVDAIVFPEHEIGTWYPTEAQKMQIRNQVEDGARFVIAADGGNNAMRILHELFPSVVPAQISHSGTYCHAQAYHSCGLLVTPESPSVPALNAVWCIPETAVPPMADIEYLEPSAAGTIPYVAAWSMKFGEGHIVFLGYDWYESRDSAWDSVLLEAVVDAHPNVDLCPGRVTPDCAATDFIPGVYHYFGSYITTNPSLCHSYTYTSGSAGSDSGSDSGYDSSKMACTPMMVVDGTAYYHVTEYLGNLVPRHDCITDMAPPTTGPADSYP